MDYGIDNTRQHTTDQGDECVLMTLNVAEAFRPIGDSGSYRFPDSACRAERAPQSPTEPVDSSTDALVCPAEFSPAAQELITSSCPMWIRDPRIRFHDRIFETLTPNVEAIL